MTDDPNSALYYKFNFYDVPTNFEYVGVRTLLGKHWSIDNRTYTMRYYNKQNYNGVTTISATSATDKLNSYWKVGNLLPGLVRVRPRHLPHRPLVRVRLDRPLSDRRRIRARGSTPRCRTSTRCSAPRRCSRSRNTSCGYRRG